MKTISNRLAVLATVLAAVAALAGLAVTGLYVDSPNWVQQAQGTDLATLFLAVPVLALGLWTASRGSSAGRLAVVAGLLYLVYNYAIFAFSVALNPLTAVHIAIFGLALWSLLLAGRSAVEGAESVTDRLNRRAAGGLLIGVATMFGLLWLGQIATVATTGVLPPDLVKADISSNPVYALDLAFFLPLCAIAGVGLLRRNGAAAFAFPMLVWVPLMGAGVVGGIVLMAAAGDQTAVPVAVAITVLGVVSSILAAVALVRPRAATGPVRPHHPSRTAGRLIAMRRIVTFFAFPAVTGAALVAAVGLWRRNPRIGTAFVNSVVNPALLRRGLAGYGRSEIGTLEHVGRVSGVRRLTPVHPEPTPAGFRIIVPLGVRSEWARNVIAAGHCRLLLHDQVFDLDEPAMVDAGQAHDLPWPLRRILAALGFQYLNLRTFASHPGSLEMAEGDALDADASNTEAVSAVERDEAMALR